MSHHCHTVLRFRSFRFEWNIYESHIHQSTHSNACISEIWDTIRKRAACSKQKRWLGVNSKYKSFDPMNVSFLLEHFRRNFFNSLAWYGADDAHMQRRGDNGFTLASTTLAPIQSAAGKWDDFLWGITQKWCADWMTGLRFFVSFELQLQWDWLLVC